MPVVQRFEDYPPAYRFWVVLIVVVTLTCAWLTVSAAILESMRAGVPQRLVSTAVLP